MAGQDWTEVGPGVFQRRYDPLDVSVGAVLGERGTAIIDTRNNAVEAQEIIEDASKRFGRPIVAAINTHAHYDHTFGNQAFAERGIEIYGHQLIPAHFERYERPHLEQVQRFPDSEPQMSWDDVVLTPPGQLLSEPCTIDLGGRELSLIPLGPGHTDTDLAIHIPDARVWFLGDLIEQSGPPMFGSGAFPLAWPQVLRCLLERIGPEEVIVPGHGTAVDRSFVAQQTEKFELLASTLHAAQTRGIPLGEIEFSRELQDLWPQEFLAEASRDVYGQLPGI